MAKLAVNLGGIAMKNPVTVASGTFGYGQEYARLFDVARLGAAAQPALCGGDIRRGKYAVGIVQTHDEARLTVAVFGILTDAAEIAVDELFCAGDV